MSVGILITLSILIIKNTCLILNNKYVCESIHCYETTNPKITSWNI